MSDDRKETFSLDGGKYEIDRNQAGLMIGARRHGEPWPAGFEQLRNMGVVHAMLDRIEALEAELAVSREAIEVCLDVAERLPSDDDGAAAVRRCTLRRLNEAVGKAVPRLMMERPEGQKLYGLNYMEMRGRIKALGAANEALEAALRIAEAETTQPAVAGPVEPTVRRQRGDAVPMLVTTQGAVRVNGATVERDYGDCLLLNVDLHSKYAELSAILTGDEEGPSVYLSAGTETLHLDETQPRGQDTTIEFHENKGWQVFASSGPGRYTLALVLVAPDA